MSCLNCAVGQAEQWGTSSNDRAPALHGGGTGTDNRVLWLSFFIYLSQFNTYKDYFSGTNRQ